jgi:hypothetical protein
MGKPKASNALKVSAKPPVPEEDLDLDLDEATPTEFSAEDQFFLRRSHTFLFNIPRYIHRAKRQAYSQKEHDLGWELWSTASGKNRPFEHWLAENDQQDQLTGISAERLRLLQEIDTFENLWFPRTRALIARVMPKDSVDRFVAAFFKNLSQQPLGPTVVDSVKTFLNRVEELKESAEPGAQTLYKTLGERGLSPKRLEAMRGLCAAAEENKIREAGPLPVSPEEIKKAKDAQLAALAALKLWYNDWATTFRGVLGARAQLVLGLTTQKRRKKADDSEGAEEGDAEDDVAGESPGDD